MAVKQLLVRDLTYMDRINFNPLLGDSHFANGRSQEALTGLSNYLACQKQWISLNTLYRFGISYQRMCECETVVLKFCSMVAKC